MDLREVLKEQIKILADYNAKSSGVDPEQVRKNAETIISLANVIHLHPWGK